ncbi:hypothetical protein AAA542_33710, partial [Pseudomonas aeruginosa]
MDGHADFGQILTKLLHHPGHQAQRKHLYCGDRQRATAEPLDPLGGFVQMVQPRKVDLPLP